MPRFIRDAAYSASLAVVQALLKEEYGLRPDQDTRKAVVRSGNLLLVGWLKEQFNLAAPTKDQKEEQKSDRTSPIQQAVQQSLQQSSYASSMSALTSSSSSSTSTSSLPPANPVANPTSANTMPEAKGIISTAELWAELSFKGFSAKFQQFLSGDITKVVRENQGKLPKDYWNNPLDEHTKNALKERGGAQAVQDQVKVIRVELSKDFLGQNQYHSPSQSQPLTAPSNTAPKDVMFSPGKAGGSSISISQTTPVLSPIDGQKKSGKA